MSKPSRAPKKPKFTPEQENALETVEREHTRAQILELGVGTFLKDHMPHGYQVEVAAEVLSEVVCLRKRANARRTEVFRHADDPAPRRR